MPTVYAFTPWFKDFDNNGNLGDGLQVFTFAAGTAPATKQSSYTDSTGNTANSNPKVLDSRGEMTLFLDTSLLYDIWLCSATESDPPINNIKSVANFGFPQTIAGPLTITGALTVGGNSIVGPVIGKTSVPISAVSMKPSVTAGCADIASVAAGAGMPDITYVAFDTTTSESCQFSIRMPTNWNEGTITFDYQWSHAATTVNFGAVFGLSAVAMSNDDTIGSAFGTEVTIADTGGTTNDLYISPESSAMTVGGTPAAGDVVYFNLARKTADASDTLAVDARLSGITLYITTDAPVG